MKNWQEDYEESDENPDEYLDESLLDDILLKEIENSDGNWARDIEKIEDPEPKEKEFNKAAKIVDYEKNLNQRLDSGEIDKDHYLREYDRNIRNDKLRGKANSALEAGNFTGEHLGDLAENMQRLDSGSVEYTATRELIKQAIDTLGSDSVRDMAEQKMDEGKMSLKSYESVLREANYSKK